MVKHFSLSLENLFTIIRAKTLHPKEEEEKEEEILETEKDKTKKKKTKKSKKTREKGGVKSEEAGPSVILARKEEL